MQDFRFLHQCWCPWCWKLFTQWYSLTSHKACIFSMRTMTTKWARLLSLNTRCSVLYKNHSRRVNMWCGFQLVVQQLWL